MKLAVLAVILAMGCNPSGPAAGGTPPGIQVGVRIVWGESMQRLGDVCVGGGLRVVEVQGGWARVERVVPLEGVRPMPPNTWINLAFASHYAVCP